MRPRRSSGAISRPSSPPEDRAAGVPERALRIAAEAGRYEAEGWRVRKDGTRFWVNAVLDPIRDDQGNLLGFAKITRDDTDKRAAVLALQESERRFRTLVQGVKDYALYMLDPDGPGVQLEYRARSRSRATGRTRSSASTSRASTPTRTERRASRPGRWPRRWPKASMRTRPGGSARTAPVSGPMSSSIRSTTRTAELLGFAKITRDITERRRAAEELEEARVALFQSQKLQALGELTGGVAHDFNNLMTVIRGAADLLARPGITEEKRARYLQAIIDTADRAATLTGHLLAFGRRQALNPEVADLNVRLDAFAEMVARTLGGKVEVKLDLAPSLPRVEVDLAQLETALLNAAFNARDAMPDGGRLTFTTRAAEPGEVMIEVADTGTGMTAEVRDRAFEPFFTTKKVGEGTGLGLSQIHGFAAQAGGRAEIRSSAGEGTAIRIFLPATERPLGASVETARAAKPPRDLRVLLVEDNEHVREFAHHLLDELGYRVLSVASGEEALEVLGAEPVDLLFSDVVMPGLSGLELARRARRDRPDLPVLLASGYSEEIVGSAGSEFEIVRKPYDVSLLESSLGAALERSAA